MYYTFITYVVFALGGAVLRSYQDSPEKRGRFPIPCTYSMIG
jgi:hypothetical protein